MIHHLVILKFKSGIDNEQIEALEAMLDELPNKIIEIHLYEFGRDLVKTDRSYDFGLSALFANLEALERYQKHPEHQKVLEKIKTLCDDVKIVDFADPQKGGQTGGGDWNRDPFKSLLG